MFGGIAGGFGGAGRHGGGMGRGRHERPRMETSRKLTSEELQLLLLLLMEQGRLYGYEFIRAIEKESSGFYVPSPGSVYPSLTYLEEAGLAESKPLGNKKQYSLTEQGLNRLGEERGRAQRILADLAEFGSRMAEARTAMEEEGRWSRRRGGLHDDLHRVRQELRDLMRSALLEGREEGSRAAEILLAAIQEIRGERRRAFTSQALFAAIAHRRSMGLSKLKPDPVPREHIERMLQAANWAPSNGDTEPWRFVVFTGEGRQDLAEIFSAAHLADHPDADASGARKRAFAAPVWIALGMSPALGEDGGPKMPREEELMAAACAIQNLHLMASSLGLAGMWHSKGLSLHPEAARRLGFAPPSELLGFFMCGWPAVEWTEGERGAWQDKVRWHEGEAQDSSRQQDPD